MATMAAAIRGDGFNALDGDSRVIRAAAAVCPHGVEDSGRKPVIVKMK